MDWQLLNYDLYDQHHIQYDDHNIPVKEDLRQVRHANQTKAESHVRIISEASRLIRERGLSGVSVSDVMTAARLTHGGFYAHFSSKDALAAAAVEAGFQEKIDYLIGPDPDALADYVSSFLSTAHVENRGAGCPIIGFAPDATTADVGEQYQAAVSDGVTQLVDALSQRLPRREARRDDAIRLLAILVGGVVMARAVKDKAMRTAILEAIRNAQNVLKAERS
jgi:TetR/AcrR family transcriptional regulator, transcriptional repressor for nem operon